MAKSIHFSEEHDMLRSQIKRFVAEEVVALWGGLGAGRHDTPAIALSKKWATLGFLRNSI